MAGWLAQVLDRTGAAKSFITPRGLSITRRLNGPAEVSFELDYEADETPDVVTGSRAIALYRDGTLRFCGPVTGRTLTGASEGGRRMTVTAQDPFAVLERRYLVPPWLDNFTAANGTLLSAHTSDTGHTYAVRSGDSDLAEVQTNRMFLDGVETELYYELEGVTTTLPFAAEFVVYNAGDTGAATYVGIGWHFDAALDDGYLAFVQGSTAADDGGSVYLQEEVADSRSNLATGADMTSDWQSSSLTIRVEQDVGGAIRVYRNGELHVSVTDTTRTTGKLVIGFLAQGTTTTGVHLESAQFLPRLAFSSTDAGAIAEDLLDQANEQQETHLQAGTIDTSVSRDRTYDEGKNIGEAIVQLAEVSSGFWFRVDPVLSGAKFGDLEVEYSDSGTDQPDVHFAFGTGQFDNLASYSVAEELPTNAVLALGVAPLTTVSHDASSIGTFGRWGAVVSHSDVSEEATLSAHAEDALETEPRKVYTVTPLPSDLSSSAIAPRLWSDFDAGDVVRLSIPDAGVDLEDASVRVLEATVAVSDDGQVESITGLALEAV